jgi:acyl-CoA thioesterase II
VRDDHDMQAALDELLTSVDVERVDEHRWRGTSPAGRRSRLFGGTVLGQVVMAASRHLDRDDLELRSMHCEFVRAGSPHEAVELAVERTSDGGTFATRRVEVGQGDQLLVTALVRFHAREAGPEHHAAMDGPLPDPLSLTDFPTRLEPHRDKVPDWHSGNVPVDVRFVAEPGPSGQTTWVRAAGRLADDPMQHSCVAIYASDMTLLGAAVLPLGLTWASPGVTMASLDHAMWFHRPFRADQWLAYEQRVLSLGAGRALVAGSMFTADGRLVATVVQDGLVRVPPS